MAKSKYDRRQWWSRLNPQEQSAYVEKVVSRKMESRAELDEREATEESVSCMTCFHHKPEVGACPGLEDTTKCCKYWFSPQSNVVGAAYFMQNVGVQFRKEQEKQHNKSSKAPRVYCGEGYQRDGTPVLRI